jgi:hypothetical protein
MGRNIDGCAGFDKPGKRQDDISFELREELVQRRRSRPRAARAAQRYASLFCKIVPTC